MFGSKVITAVALAIAFYEGTSHAGGDPWFFTADEIARTYDYQQHFGARLPVAIPAATSCRSRPA